MKQTHPYIIATLLTAGLLAGCSSPDQSPTVQLSTTQPAQDTRPLTLVATVTSPASTPIVKVEFFKGETKLGEDTTSPYEQEVPINVEADTTLEFSAKATDQQNRSGKKSLLVPVTADNQAPTVELSGSSSTFVTGGTLNLSATASDNIGVAKVEFFKGTTKLGEDAEAPYVLAVPITATLNGPNPFSAKAHDFKGLQSSSNTLSVNVDIDDVLPTISLNISSNNLNAVGSLTLNATASDNKGIAKVEFYKGTTKLGEDTTSPYTFDVAYSESYNNTDSFSAKAIDLDGNITTSDAVTAAVDIDITLPSIELTGSSPSFSAPGSLTLTAAASDNRGVTKVEFYKQGTGDTTLLSTVTAPPYTHTLSITAPDNGQLYFTAKAFDAHNNVNDDGEAISVAIAPDISSFSTPTGISSDGGVFALNWVATGQSGFNLSVNSTTGLSGLSAGALGPSVFAQNLSLSSNTTRFDRTYDFTLTANGYGGMSPTSRTLRVSQNPAFGKVSTGANNGCAFIAGLPHCWGHSMALGSSGGISSATPVLVSQGAIPSGVSLTRIAVGANTACALASNGWAYCWGYNGHGQVGEGTGINRPTPVALANGVIPSGVTLTQIDTMDSHSCAIGSNGATYCWGYGNNGRLGNGAITTSATPVAVSQGAIPSGVTLSQISLGYNHSCGLGSNGAAYCWGYNNFGQLGNASTNSAYTPVAVSQGARPANVSYTRIASGANHVCALGSNNQIYCWGSNLSAMLGDGTTTTRNTPVALVGTNVPDGVNFTEVAAGTDHTCALGSDNRLYCWGTGTAAGGANATETIAIPKPLPPIDGVPVGFRISQLSATWSDTCGIGSDKRAYCWGITYPSSRTPTPLPIPGPIQ